MAPGPTVRTLPLDQKAKCMPTGGRFERDFLLLCAIVAFGLAFSIARQLGGHHEYLVDFRAFYCGGSVLLHHSDPYTVPSTACTHAIRAGAAVLRAPHPPFALAIYALMALFPFKLVGLAYITIAWLAVGATARVLSKLVPIDSAVIALGLAPLLGYYCITLGQPTPFVALFVVCCAYVLRTDRPIAASAFAAMTLVFPHVGLPVVAALFVCRPATRRPVTICVAFLVLAGLAILGVAANVHYVTQSLRLEQLQTAEDSGQYSLPWLLQQLGSSSTSAAAIGSSWYLAVVTGGIVWLRRCATHAERTPLVALMPAALATLCGTFLHQQHFALALPVAMFALGSRPKIPALAVLGTALLLVPWTTCIFGRSFSHDLGRTATFLLIGVIFTALAAPRAGARMRGATVAVVLGSYVLVSTGIYVALLNIANVDILPNDLTTLSVKLPTIAGVLLVLAFGVFGTAQPEESFAAGGMSFGRRPVPGH